MSEITIKPELKSTPTKDGLNLVLIRITQNKKHKRLSVRTDSNEYMKVSKNQWSGSTGSWIKKNHPNYKAYNENIQFELTKYGKEHKKLAEDNLVISKKEVFEAVNKVIYKQNFMSYYDSKVSELKNWNNEKIYTTTKNKIIDCFGDKPFDFSEMTADWLKKFDTHLRKTNGVVALSINMKKIKRIWNMAIDIDKVANRELYPFGKGKYQIPSTKNHKKQLERLTEKEIQSLFKCQYGNTDVYDTKDLKFYAHKGFLLAFLCAGIRIEDLLLLKWSNEKADEFVYTMAKGVAAGKIKKFGKNKQIQDILDELRPDNYKKDDLIFPFLKKGIDMDKSKEGQEKLKKAIGGATSVYNKCLKKIGEDIGTTKNMVSHLARHSWSAIMYERYNDLLMIQENLDHENIETTIGYIGQLSTAKNDKKLSNVYDILLQKAK